MNALKLLISSNKDEKKPEITSKTDSVITNSAYNIMLAGGRKLVRLNNGWLVAGMINGTIIRFYVSKDKGFTWTQVCTKDRTTPGGNYRWLAMCAVGTVVHSISDNGDAAGAGSRTIEYVKFDATTQTNTNIFSSIITLDNPGELELGDGCSIAAGPDGAIHAVWCSINSTYPNSFNMRYSKSTNSGNTWETPTQIGTNNNTAITGQRYPCLIIRNNLPVIIYQWNQPGTNHYIYCFRHTGSSWTASAVFNANGNYEQVTPCAVLDNNNDIHVVWSGQDSTDTTAYNIRYSKSTDGGVTWSTPIKLTSGNSYHQHNPSICVDGNNNLSVSWNGQSASSPSTYQIRRLSNISGVWSNAINYTMAGSNQLYAQTTERYTNEPVLMYQDNSRNAIRFHNEYFNDPSTNTSVITGAFLDTAGVGGRKITVLSNGWIIVAARNTGNNAILFFVSKDNGATWQQICHITGTTATFFAIASYGTMVYCIRGTDTESWTGPVFTRFDAATLTGNPNLYSDTTCDYAITNTETSLGNGCSITADANGVIHAVWCSKNTAYPSCFNVRYSKSTNGGNTWATPMQLSSMTLSGLHRLFPCIVATKTNNLVILGVQLNNGTYYGAWYKRGNGDVWVEGSDYGVSWLPTIANNAYTLYPCAAVDSQNVIHVVFHGLDTTDNLVGNIRYFKSADDGVTWSSGIKLTSGNSYWQSDASITVDAYNNLYVLWTGVDPAVANSIKNLRFMCCINGQWGQASTLTNVTTAGKDVLGVQTPEKFNDFSYPLVTWADNANNQLYFKGNKSSVRAPSIVVNQDYNIEGNGGRKITILQNGWWVVAAKKPDNTIDYYVSKDNGISFSKLTTLNNTSTSNFAIASFGNVVYTLFTGVISAVSLKFDVTGTVKTVYELSDCVNIDNQNSIGNGCSIAVGADGVIHAVWCSKNNSYPNCFNVRYSKSTNGGNTWSTPMQITTLVGVGDDMFMPTIIVYNNNPIIIARYVYNNELYVMRYNGTSWPSANYGRSTTTIISGATSYLQISPCAVVDNNGHIHVVWSGQDSTDTTAWNIRYSKSTDGGASWSTPIKLTSGNTSSNDWPTITVDSDNNIWVFWHGDIGTSYWTVRYRIFKDNQWSATSNLVFSFSNFYQRAVHTSDRFTNFIFPPLIWQDNHMKAIRAVGILKE